MDETIIRAKNIMKTSVIVVKKDTSINKAIAMLIKNNITGLPVVHEDMTLAGIISEKDILKFLSDLNLLSLIEDLKSSSAKVEDCMTKNVFSLDIDADIVEICDCLVQNNFRRVPILSEGKLVGIISRKDIIANISEKNVFVQ
jgi:CBS domain-containing protein